MIIATTTKDFKKLFPDLKMHTFDWALYEQLCVKEDKELDAVIDSNVLPLVDAI